MMFFGISLRKPSFNEFTASAVLAVGLWMLGAGLMRASGHPLSSGDAGAALMISLWSCLSTRLGIRLDEGGRHLVASLGGSAMVWMLYEAARQLVA